MNTVERALHIGERVRAAYLGEGARRFWPEQFADDLGSEGEVLEALRSLVQQGKLEAQVQIRSSDHRHEGGLGDDEDWKAVMSDQPRKKTDPGTRTPPSWPNGSATTNRAQARAAFDVVEAEVVLRDQRMLADALGRVLVKAGVLQPNASCTGAELLLAAEVYAESGG